MLKLNDAIISNLKNIGISALTPMQTKIFDIVSNNHNTLLSSPTGTGKTVAFVLPLISKVLEEKHKYPYQVYSPQVLILSPCHVLNSQILHCVIKVTTGLQLKSFLYPYPVGIPPKNFYNPNILISTVGSIISKHKSSSSITKFLQNTTTIVLDEADYLLKQSQTQRLLKHTKSIQKIFTGATLKPQDIIKGIAPDLKIYNVTSELQPVPPNIEQIELDIPFSDHLQEEKLHILIETIQKEGGKHLVFTNTIPSGQDLFHRLKSQSPKGIDFFLFNGNQEYEERLATLRSFKFSDKTALLISTDLLARGMDFDGMEIKTVWNYDFPKTTNDYIHRVGRTGRMGATGKAYSFRVNACAK